MATDNRLGRIVVEVAYARADEQTTVELELVDGATAGEAIQGSGLLERYPEIDLAVNRIGVFGQPIELDRSIRHKDRIEIYRPLLADPKEARRRRAEAAKRRDQYVGRR